MVIRTVNHQGIAVPPLKRDPRGGGRIFLITHQITKGVDMAHGLETIKRLNKEADEAHSRRNRSKSFEGLSPAMRERSVKRLLAAIDLAIAQRHLNPRSIIADARLDLGDIMNINEAEKV